MTRRRLALPLALVGAVIVGSVATVAVRGGAPAPAAPASPTVTTATVVRTDLATTVLTGATLGYAPTDPVVNRLSGTYTQLPPVGAVIAAGQILYRVDNQPVILMTGDDARVATVRRRHDRRSRRGRAAVQSDRASGTPRALLDRQRPLRRAHCRRHRALAARRESNPSAARSH